MSNLYCAVNWHGVEVAEFLSRDYDPDELVRQHGAVTVFDRSDGGRFITAIRPRDLGADVDGHRIIVADVDTRSSPPRP